MRKIILFGGISAVILFSGCSRLDPKKDIEKQAKELAKTYITSKYNDILKEHPTYKAYLISDKIVFCISDGVVKIPEGNDFEHAKISRAYNAAKITFEIKDSGVMSITESDNSEYPYRSKLSVEYLENYEFLENINGVEICTHLPENWAQLDPEEQKKFVNSLQAKLPDVRYDYSLIAETNGNANSRQVTDNVTIRYSAAKQVWEFEENIDAKKINAEVASWQKSHPQTKITAALMENGLEQVEDVFMTAEDKKIHEYIRTGYIWVNGQWKNKKSLEFSKIFNAHPKENYTWENVEKLVIATFNNQDAEDYQEACKLLKFQISERVNIAQKSIWGILIVLEAMNSNEAWNVIDQTENKKILLAEAKKHIDALELVFTDLEKLDKDKAVSVILNRLEPFNKHKIFAEGNKVALFYLFLTGDWKLSEKIKENLGDEYKNITDKLIAKCPYCNNGVKRCNVCRDSKICISCKGTGVYYYSDIVDRKFVQRSRRCPTACTACIVAKPCKHCHGQGIRPIPKNQVLKFLKSQRNVCFSEIQLLRESLKKYGETTETEL